MFFALLLIAGSASAQTIAQMIQDDSARPPRKVPRELTVPPPKEDPLLVRMMIHPIRGGMFIGLPVVDTDPNRGATYGVMPIWVFQQSNGESGARIKHIHAPSLTYNRTFKWNATHRYYYYPTPKASYFARGSLTGNQNKDLIGEMEDLDFLGRSIALSARLAYDVDGSKRFYGIGPDTPEDAETNFTRKSFGYFVRLGLPVFRDSGWKFNVAHRLFGERIAPGVFDTLPSIETRFPQHTPAHWHQDSEVQLFVDYDTRDSAVTSSKGSYLKFLIENSQRIFGSEFTFQRYTAEVRHFHPHKGRRRRVTAGQILYSQLVGDAPFYVLPSLGGKELHRAYGEGRYIDKGVLMTQLEERFTVYQVEVAGVTTEVELAPFVGLGTVFNTPDRISRRYFRPVVGGAVRMVARPQVVGSIDVGVGQEGPAVFMDINYSF